MEGLIKKMPGIQKAALPGRIRVQQADAQAGLFSRLKKSGRPTSCPWSIELEEERKKR
jgi:hypothetical protein